MTNPDGVGPDASQDGDVTRSAPTSGRWSPQPADLVAKPAHRWTRAEVDALREARIIAAMVAADADLVALDRVGGVALRDHDPPDPPPIVYGAL